MGRIVGIDLGTLYSSVTIPEDRRELGFLVVPECPGCSVILDQFQRAVTPSIVAENEHGEIVVGYAARAHSGSLPQPIAFSKRHMGEDRSFVLGEHGTLRPEEVSAHVLRHLKRVAEERLGAQVDEAVITVPEHFSVRARHMTTMAARIAGFRRARLASESVAAALASCANDPRDPLMIMTYDLGAAFQVAIILKRDGVMSILSSADDALLGGCVFDEKLALWISLQLQQQGHDFSWDRDHRENTAVAEQVRALAEQAKVRLSREESALIDESDCGMRSRSGASIPLRLEVTRAQFASLIRDDVERTIDLCQEVMKRVNPPVQWEDIDEIALVGGSSRIPLVAQRLEEQAGRKPRLVQPELCVALGAGLLAGQLVVADTVPTTAVMGCVVIDEPISVGMSDGARREVVPVGAALPVESEVRLETSGAVEELRLPVFLGDAALGEVVEDVSALSPGSEIRVLISVDVERAVRARVVTGGVEHAVELTGRPHAASQVDAGGCPVEHRAKASGTQREGPDVIGDSGTGKRNEEWAGSPSADPSECLSGGVSGRAGVTRGTGGSSRAFDDNVQFTVYRPTVVRPVEWYPMLVFSHLAEARSGDREQDPVGQVERQARGVLQGQIGEFRRLVQDSAHAIPREGTITLVPDVADIEFNPPRRSFQWQESVHREEFRLRAAPSLDGETVRGRISVYHGVVILAELALSIRVDSTHRSAAGRAPFEEARSRPYRRIFASYSHKDLDIVRQFERYASTLGDRYLRDWSELRAGEEWSDRLAAMIREADVFQLFWSWNSMASNFVRQEWEYALSLGRSNFVRPTYWEEPLPATADGRLPPEALRRLHFQALCESGLPMPRGDRHAAKLETMRGRAEDAERVREHVERFRAIMEGAKKGIDSPSTFREVLRAISDLRHDVHRLWVTDADSKRAVGELAEAIECNYHQLGGMRVAVEEADRVNALMGRFAGLMKEAEAGIRSIEQVRDLRSALGRIRTDIAAASRFVKGQQAHAALDQLEDAIKSVLRQLEQFGEARSEQPHPAVPGWRGRGCLGLMLACLFFASLLALLVVLVRHVKPG
jgi:molecular chaperone DnaK (HSP70)